MDDLALDSEMDDLALDLPEIPMTLEEGLSKIEVGIAKIKRVIEGKSGPQFDAEDHASLYTTIYTLCTQKPPHDYSKQVYDRYREAVQDYCKQTVLRSLRKKHGENMLEELALKWSNHKHFVRWLSHLFAYIERYYLSRRSSPTLNEIGLICFRELVYKEVKSKATEAVISLIRKEREGEEIDRVLLKNVLDVYVEIGMGHMKIYEEDFENFMLQDTTSYYSRKTPGWIHEYSCSEYMLKCEECLKKERERVTQYLQLSTVPKLVKALKELFNIGGSATVAEVP